jgi:hypothetical protein
MQQYAPHDRKTSLTFGETAVEITGTAPARKKRSRFGSSSSRFAEECPLSGGKADMAFCGANVR